MSTPEATVDPTIGDENRRTQCTCAMSAAAEIETYELDGEWFWQECRPERLGLVGPFATEEDALADVRAQQTPNDGVRWPDGRQVRFERVFPNLPEVKGMPDWSWFVEDWDLGDPCGSYFQTKADAIADARAEIEEARQQLVGEPHNLVCRRCGERFESCAPYVAYCPACNPLHDADDEDHHDHPAGPCRDCGHVSAEWGCRCSYKQEMRDG